MSINDQQRTRVTQSIARLNVRPLNNVNFSQSVGTVIPRDIHLQTLPADVVEIVPQYRGYNFFVVRDEIVIVEPSTYKIVTVLPRSGGSTAAAPASSRTKVTVTDKDRDIVRKHVRASTERRTTGSSGSTRVEIRRGERLSDTVEVEEFPKLSIAKPLRSGNIATSSARTGPTSWSQRSDALSKRLTDTS